MARELRPVGASAVVRSLLPSGLRPVGASAVVRSRLMDLRGLLRGKWMNPLNLDAWGRR